MLDFNNTLDFLGNTLQIDYPILLTLLILLILIELFVSFIIVLNKQNHRYPYILLILLLMFFNIINIVLIYNRADSCGCFGTIFPVKPWPTIIKNLILLFLTIVLLYRNKCISFHIKYIIIIMLTTLIIGLALFFILETTKPELLPPGSTMPEIQYLDKNGSHVLQIELKNKSIIMFFSLDCDHCLYQLSQFQRHIDELGDMNLILLTPDKNVFINHCLSQFDILLQRKNVTLGIVEKNIFKTKFGSTALPILFCFNSSGQLIKKFKGETKFRKIGISMNIYDDPDRQIKR